MEYIKENEIVAEPPEEIVLDLSGDKGAPDSTIRELKSAVLAIDWEITDSILLRFNEEITELMQTLKGDGHSVRLLRLLDTVGRYIRNKRADAHPLSIRLLHSSFNILEELVTRSRSLAPDYKTEQVAKAYAAFRELKEAIVSQARSTAPTGDQEPAPSPGPTTTPERSEMRTTATPPAQASSTEAAELPTPALAEMVRAIVREELDRFKQEIVKELQALGHGA